MVAVSHTRGVRAFEPTCASHRSRTRGAAGAWAVRLGFRPVMLAGSVLYAVGLLLFASVSVAVFAAGIGAMFLPRSFLPPFNEGTLVLSLQYNPGISLAESHRLGLLAEMMHARRVAELVA